jgi:hypothetical protein
MKSNKDFDAVEMMRSIRTKLQDIYDKDPDLKRKRLSEIRKRYRTKTKKGIFAGRI